MQRRSLAQPRRNLAAVHLAHVALEIEDRNHDRAVEVLVTALAQNAELLQTAAHLRSAPAVLVRQPVAERAVGKADAKLRDHLRVREPTAFEVLQRLGTLLQRLVVIIDHLAQHTLIVGGHLERRLQLYRLRGCLVDHALDGSG